MKNEEFERTMKLIPDTFIPGAVGALLALVALAAAASGTHAYQIGSIKIDHPYARATAPGQPAGGGYMTLINGGVADRLVSASAGVSRSVELHEMKMEGDLMKMRQVDGIEMSRGSTVELKPGGFHVMFIGLKAPLREGASFPMKLTFEKAGELTVEVEVEAPGRVHGAAR